MPKPHSYPTLFDRVKTINISFLKANGYLSLNHWKSGFIHWVNNQNRTGFVSIQVNTLSNKPFMSLKYNCNGLPIEYNVQLISVKSNLGKGVVWFFICPKTAKRCRKLYLVDTYFYHRTAFSGCMYEKQTKSKSYRELEKFIDNLI